MLYANAIKKSLEIVIWNIIDASTDVIVNSANSTLLWGGGVDGDIHLAAGEQLYQECQLLRNTEYFDGLPEWLAVLTKGYNLPAKYIIHTVAPYCRGYLDDSWLQVLEACYINCLEIAEENNLTSISFPSLWTGIFWCDKVLAAEVALKTICNYILDNPASSLKKISFVLFNQEGFEIYQKVYSTLLFS